MREQRPTGTALAKPGATLAPDQRGWDSRLATGLALPTVPRDIRSPLEGALGLAGVEAEYFLALSHSLHNATAPSPASRRALGASFLTALEAAGHRLLAIASRVELAAQGYVTSLAATGPAVRALAGAASPWWSAPDAAPWSGLTIEADLRRHGFSLRQVAEVHLGETVEALAERMALTLHALASLPPAGVLPVISLAAGIDQLAELWQDDIATHLVRDVTPTYPGLLSAIARLRQEDAASGADLAADLAWARAQYDAVRALQGQHPQQAEGSMVGAAERTAMVNESARSWQEIIALLEGLAAGAAR